MQAMVHWAFHFEDLHTRQIPNHQENLKKIHTTPDSPKIWMLNQADATSLESD